jgi:hypothetical protein
MASSGKKKTTMAKLTRESRLRERRIDKQARKDARKNAPPESDQPTEPLEGDEFDGELASDGEPVLSGVSEPPPDA